MTTRQRRAQRPYLFPLLMLAFFGLTSLNHPSNQEGVLLGGLAGGLGFGISMQLSQLWRLLGRPVGHTVNTLNIGTGRRLTQWRIGSLPVILRWFPLPLLIAGASLIERPGLRWRLWLANLVSIGGQLGLGIWLLVSDTGFLRWLGGAELFLPLLSLALVRVPLAPGWVLFRLPFLPSDALAEFALRPAEVAVVRALGDGRAGAAQQALRELPDGVEPSFETYRLRAVVALTEGRYSDAAANAQQSGAKAPHRMLATVPYFVLAAAIVGAAETGELPPTEYLHLLSSAVDAATTRRTALARAFPPAADLARLEGDYDTAVKLARTAARLAVDPFWLAQSECSYAAALAANGQAAEARSALDRARKAMPELARISTVAQRIGLPEVSGVQEVSRD